MKRLKQIHIPTLVAILVLALGIGATVFLIQQRQSYKTKASVSSLPNNLKVSNQTAFINNKAEATVTWQTDEVTAGFILYGFNSDELSFMASDTRDKQADKEGYYKNHYVELVNLPVDKTIYYTIGVNNLGVGQCQNNKTFCTDSSQCGNGDCVPFTLKTPPPLESRAAKLAQGQLLDSQNQPVSGGLVFISSTGTNLLSAITDQQGQWAVNLSLLRQADLKSYFNLDSQASRVNLTAVYQGQTTQGQCLTSNLDPAPAIIVGQAYDCLKKNKDRRQNLPIGAGQPTASPDNNQNSSQIDKQPLKESGFALDEEILKLTNPARDGAKIATKTPVFSGFGPKEKTIKIIVHSNQEIVADVYIDENGQWHWTPPASLEPGEHTIQLVYTDDAGNEHQLTRRFFVAADGSANQLPEYTASASAQVTEPTPTLAVSTPTPTLEPTATPLPQTSMPATDAGVPTSGIETFYLFLGLAFVFLTLSGFSLYTQSRG